MKDEVRDRLDTLLAARPVRSETAVPDEVADSGGFDRAFLVRAERVVYPAMLEIGRLVERHGRFFSIELISERSTCRGVVIPPSVQMNFFRRQRTTNFKHSCPHFNVVCDRPERKVIFQRTTMTSGSGPRTDVCGRCTIEQLTRDLVQDKIAATLDVLLAA